MVEAGAKQVSEDDMLEALLFAHEEIKRLCEFQEEIQKAIGKEKMVPDLFKIPEELEKSIREFAEPELIPAISTHEKLAREAAIEAVNEKTREHFNEIFENDEKLSLQEIEENKEYLKNNEITTIYIGGGTPSSIKEEHIKEILEKIFEVANIKNKEKLEITIEVNPGTVTKEKLQMFKNCGICL